MSGSLIKIQETTVSSSTATVTLTGINSTYDVYKVVWSNVTVDTDTKQLQWRYNNASGPVTSGHYDKARVILKANAGTFTSSQSEDANQFNTVSIGTGTQEKTNGTLYLFNFNTTSEYSFHTEEATSYDYQPTLAGIQGGGVLTVAEAHTGLTFFVQDSNNLESGTFTLYGLKK
tara:strand:- start:569 stop:1090 length:522 start_codon:yes stop_codon:yes gene_type:complete